MKNPKEWMGRPIAQESDHEDLERLAAHKQFREGLSNREDADAAAYDHYIHETHEKAAAHHLGAMRDSMSSGSPEIAQKHHAHYLAHVRKLGHKGNMNVAPEEVQRHMQPGHQQVAKFTNHPGDLFLVKK